jgi:rRNA maturation RNase YbeY
MAISFFFQDTRVTLTDRRRLKEFISSLFVRYGKKLESLTYVFCTDKYLLEINRKFLKHNFYTDIVTFNLSKSPKIVEGEIYISVDRVKDNAGNLDLSAKEELHRVMFHGALHLCGLNDKSKTEKAKMTLEEDKNLRKYFF